VGYYVYIRWGDVHQARKGYLMLRISRKNNKNKPRILMKVGKTDKLINDYLEVYAKFMRSSGISSMTHAL